MQMLQTLTGDESPGLETVRHDVVLSNMLSVKSGLTLWRCLGFVKAATH